MATAVNYRILHLENGQSEHITVNGVPCRFIRRDLGPTQNIEFQAGVNGYTAGSRGKDIAQLSFWPEHRTEPTWDIA